MARDMSLEGFQATGPNADMATLTEGRFLATLFRLDQRGITAVGLGAYHTLNGQVNLLPETDPATDPDPMHPGRGLRDPSLPALRKWNADGTPLTGDEPAAQQPGTTDNLAIRKVPDNMPLNLVALVKEHSESAAVPVQVGTALAKYKADARDHGKPTALVNLFEDVYAKFQENEQIKEGAAAIVETRSAFDTVLFIVSALPGVTAAINTGIPDAP